MPPTSAACGRTIAELNLRRDFRVEVLELRRGENSPRIIKKVTQHAAGPDAVIESGDALYVRGEDADIRRMAEMLDFSVSDGNDNKNTGKGLEFYDIGIAEIVLMPHSRLINRSIADSGFRNRFGVSVIAVRRNENYITADLSSLTVRAGDVLLIQGSWEAIGNLSNENSDWVVLGQPMAEASKVTLDYKAPVAAAIMAVMVAMLVIDTIPAVITVLGAAVRGRLPQNKLGKHCPYSRHDADVIRSGEDRHIGHGVGLPRSHTRFVRPHGSYGRNLFHHISHDIVHQQYRDSSTARPYRVGERRDVRRKPSAIPFCCHIRRKPVLRFAVLDPA